MWKRREDKYKTLSYYLKEILIRFVLSKNINVLQNGKTYSNLIVPFIQQFGRN